MPTLTQTRLDKYGIPIWKLQIYDGQGKRTIHTFHGTRREALLWRDKIMSMQKQTTRENISVADYATRWLIIKKKELKNSTYQHYTGHINNQIIPALGRYKLSALSPDNIKNFLAEISSRQITGATQLRYYRTLSSMLQDAVYDGYMDNNPARNVRPPTAIKTESEFYEEELITKIIKLLPSTDKSIQIPLAIAITTGMRRGEILALIWDNIDIKNREITVSHSVDYVNGVQVRIPPKSISSTRVIPIPHILANLLTTARQTRQTEYVCEVKGEWLKYYYLDDLLHDFLTKNDLPKITFHKLRHTAASILIKSGVGVRDLSDILGHAQTNTTLNIYSHSFKKTRKDAVKIFDKISKTIPK